MCGIYREATFLKLETGILIFLDKTVEFEAKLPAESCLTTQKRWKEFLNKMEQKFTTIEKCLGQDLVLFFAISCTL